MTDISPDALFKKIVQNHRGGFCFEQNGMKERYQSPSPPSSPLPLSPFPHLSSPSSLPSHSPYLLSIFYSHSLLPFSVCHSHFLLTLSPISSSPHLSLLHLPPSLLLPLFSSHLLSLKRVFFAFVTRTRL